MTPDQAKALRADFAAWTGGFEPEDEQQIDTYIEGSLGVDLDADEARMDLMLWMQEIKPLDPQQSFVAFSLTREEIAIELSGLGSFAAIKPTDPRLTDEFCTAFAREYGEQVSVDADDLAGSDEWNDFIESMLDKLNS